MQSEQQASRSLQKITGSEEKRKRILASIRFLHAPDQLQNKRKLMFLLRHQTRMCLVSLLPTVGFDCLSQHRGHVC